MYNLFVLQNKVFLINMYYLIIKYLLKNTIYNIIKMITNIILIILYYIYNLQCINEG